MFTKFPEVFFPVTNPKKEGLIPIPVLWKSALLIYLLERHSRKARRSEVKMASLSARAFAELLDMPAYKQARILAEQKHPRRGPQAFKVPYYASALKGIRDFYRQGRTRASLQSARNAITSLRPDSRSDHNMRVLDQFEASGQDARQLIVLPLKTYKTRSGSVDVSLRFDLVASEGQNTKYIFYNTRMASIDKETAYRTLEIAHWVMQKEGSSACLSELEYVDLPSGKVYHRSQRRATTIRKMSNNIKVIDALWPIL